MLYRGQEIKPISVKHKTISSGVLDDCSELGTVGNFNTASSRCVYKNKHRDYGDFVMIFMKRITVCSALL